MSEPMRGAHPSLLLPALFSAFLAGCGSSPAPGSSAGKPVAAMPGQAVHNTPAGTPATAPDADLVAAVSSGGSGPPISVKFRLGARPVVGSPAAVSVALMPTPGLAISHIHASLRGDEGLQLQGNAAVDVEDPQDGAVLTQDVTVVPQREGVLSLSIIVVVDYEKTSVARTYVIPLIASNAAS